jgi:phage shock protein E
MKKILGIFLVVILTFIFGCCPKENGKVIMKTNSTLIDVRTIEEYKAGFITGAVNIPYDEIENKIFDVVKEKTTPIYLYCRSGRRSAIAKATLEKIGFNDITDLGSFNDAQTTLSLPIVK